MGLQFGSFDSVCSTAALVICPMLGASSQGIEPSCYSRNVQIGSTLIFQPSTSFIHIIAIIMTAIMIYHIRSKYTAVGRKEIVMFFWMYMLIQFLALFLDSGVIPTSNVSYPWFAAVYSGLVSAIYCCLLINGFVGFQFAEDGTPVSLWLLRLSTLAVFGLSFFISIATFKSLASFSPSKPTALFVIYLIWPIICVVTYTLSQLILVFRTLDDRWPLGDVLFGIGFYTVAQVLLFAFSVTICNAIQHYLDGLFFFELCVLLSVMMVYKYWDSITREDLEFSVGSKAAVWEIKDPLLAGSYEDSSDAGYGANTNSVYHGGGGYGNGSQYGGNAQSMYGGPSPSLVGGLSGTQMYSGAGAGKGGYGGRGYPPNNAERY